MPVKPVTKEEILKGIVPADCFWEEMGNLTNTPIRYIHEAMDSWAALQTAERNERILELEAGLNGVLLFIEDNGEPLDGFRFREEAIKAKQILTKTIRDKRE